MVIYSSVRRKRTRRKGEEWDIFTQIGQRRIILRLPTRDEANSPAKGKDQRKSTRGNGKSDNGF